MVSSEEEAQQVVIHYFAGVAWPTLLLLVSSSATYVSYLLIEPTLSLGRWQASPGVLMLFTRRYMTRFTTQSWG